MPIRRGWSITNHFWQTSYLDYLLKKFVLNVNITNQTVLQRVTLTITFINGSGPVSSSY